MKKRFFQWLCGLAGHEYRREVVFNRKTHRIGSIVLCQRCQHQRGR